MNRALRVQYFNCDRPLYAQLSGLLGETPAPAADARACAERRGSAWVVCQTYKDVDHSQKRARFARELVFEHLLPTAMDALFFLAPGIEGVPQTLGQAARGAVQGALVGGAIGWALAPDSGRTTEELQSRVALARSDLLPDSADEFARASQSLETLRKHDPYWDSVVAGALAGGGTGLFGGAEAGARAEESSAESADARAVESWRKLKDPRYLDSLAKGIADPAEREGVRAAADSARESLGRLVDHRFALDDPVLRKTVVERFPAEEAEALALIREWRRRGRSSGWIEAELERLAASCAR
jgi:hypothetical protein